MSEPTKWWCGKCGHNGPMPERCGMSECERVTWEEKERELAKAIARSAKITKARQAVENAAIMLVRAKAADDKKWGKFDKAVDALIQVARETAR